MEKYITKQNDAFTRTTFALQNLRGFSLIELLVAIAIIATIIGLALPNFLGARTRARDTKRKGEAQQFRTALQLYYTDYGRFPANAASPGYGKPVGCGTVGTSACPCSGTIDFAAGGTGCTNIYMTKLPSELGTTMKYYQRNSGADYCIKVPLENASDTDAAASRSRCAANCAASPVSPTGSDYVVCSE